MVKLDLDLGPDQHSEKPQDPDPHKMNADPQPWLLVADLADVVLLLGGGHVAAVTHILTRHLPTQSQA